MLHFGSRIAFGVDVGNFFELQCTFQCDREVVAPTQIEGISHTGIADFLCDVFNFFFILQYPCNLTGNIFQFLHQLVVIGFGNGASAIAQIQCHEGQQSDLSCKGFSRGNADFGPGMDIRAGISHACDGRAYSINHAVDEGTFIFGHFEGGQGICRFTGLGKS